jgi:hypothetical protein
MIKHSYKFSDKSLVYEKVRRSLTSYLIIFIPIALVIVLVLFLTLDSERISKKEQNSLLEFYKKTDNYIGSKDTVDIKASEIKILFNSVDRVYKGKLNEYGFIKAIEDYYSRISSISNDSISKRIYSFIENEKVIEPFSFLPSEQRRILTNLKGGIESGNINNLNFNFVELNSVLIHVNDQLQSEIRKNSWSIPLAIIGILVSLFFGITTRYYKNINIPTIERVDETKTKR